jgi:hypothetical protein
MAEYRVYLIDSDDRFYDVVPLICADDDEAMEMAKQCPRRWALAARPQGSQVRPQAENAVLDFEQLRRSPVLLRGSVAMNEKSDRAELLRRLEQARRIAKEPDDPLTKERLARLIRDLEEQLRY